MVRALTKCARQNRNWVAPYPATGGKVVGPYFCPIVLLQLPRFHVPFWLSYILVYLFYFYPSFCPSWELYNK